MENKRKSYSMRNYSRATYEDGSAVRVRKPEIQEQTYVQRVKQEQEGLQVKIKVKCGINLFSMLFLLGAIIVTLFMCFYYLKIQAEVTALSKSISSLERQISSLERENDAFESDMNTEKYDLEQIYQIAVGTLGMVYPNENEIIYYEVEDSGYYRQYQDIPE